MFYLVHGVQKSNSSLEVKSQKSKVLSLKSKCTMYLFVCQVKLI